LRDWSSVHDTIARAERTVVVGSGMSGGGASSGSSNSMSDHHGMSSIAHEEYDLSIFHHKLNAAQGIAYLSEGRYREAAASFTMISSEILTNQYSSVISAEDLALYGGILGWAALDRETVCTVLMEGAFKARLEVSVYLMLGNVVPKSFFLVLYIYFFPRCEDLNIPHFLSFQHPLGYISVYIARTIHA
jgi:hypothetical protein